MGFFVSIKKKSLSAPFYLSMGGLEPPRILLHTPLKRARIPIPPHRHIFRYLIYIKNIFLSFDMVSVPELLTQPSRSECPRHSALGRVPHRHIFRYLSYIKNKIFQLKIFFTMYINFYPTMFCIRENLSYKTNLRKKSRF